MNNQKQWESEDYRYWTIGTWARIGQKAKNKITQNNFLKWDEVLKEGQDPQGKQEI